MIVEFFDIEKGTEAPGILFSQEGDSIPVPNVGHNVALRNGKRAYGGEVKYVSWSFDTTGEIGVKIGVKVLLNFNE